jgi:hypothetical protein
LLGRAQAVQRRVKSLVEGHRARHDIPVRVDRGMWYILQDFSNL